MNTAETNASPESLREAMIARTRDHGYPIGPAVERALRTVERHIFVLDASLQEAYAHDIVVTKRGAGGDVLSCASQPSIVAMQLEQLGVRSGQRVLEIGAGTGYNAALLAHLAGPGGQVTAIDVDSDIVEHARSGLAAAGAGNVDVVLGDGALGHRAAAPFDRIIATVGAYGIPDSWLDQLAPGGRLVVPIRIRGGVSRSVAFEHCGDGTWRSVDHQMCGFIPLRAGIADDPRRKTPLTADGSVMLQLHQEHTIDPAGLLGVLDRPRHEVWTGVVFRPMQSVEWLYLWCACVLDTSLCAMSMDQATVDAGVVEPMFGTTTMAVPGDGELAYLTWRVAGHTEDGRKIMEVGVIGHGATGATLATRVAEEIRTWNEQHRDTSTVHFEIPTAGTTPTEPAGNRFRLDRPHNPLTVVWQ